jgi:hypothetical protein
VENKLAILRHLVTLKSKGPCGRGTKVHLLKGDEEVTRDRQKSQENRSPSVCVVSTTRQRKAPKNGYKGLQSVLCGAEIGTAFDGELQPFWLCESLKVRPCNAPRGGRTAKMLHEQGDEGQSLKCCLFRPLDEEC